MASKLIIGISSAQAVKFININQAKLYDYVQFDMDLTGDSRVDTSIFAEASKPTPVVEDQTNNFSQESDFQMPSSGITVNLVNENGAGYIGTVWIAGQPARVLFDTGSDYLAVTSSLCNVQSLGQKEEDVPVFNPVSLVYEPSG